MIIHLLAPKDQSKWHPIWKYCYKSWKNYPYEIKVWGDEDIDELLKEDNEEFFNTLDTLHPIYKWDYVRYLILEKWGGGYFDMDVEIIDPSFIPKLSPEEIYIAEGDWNCNLSNHIIISPPPSYSIKFLWRSILETSQHKILENFDKCKHDSENTVFVAGPIFLSNYASKWQFNHTRLGWTHFSDPNSKLCYSKHHNTSNWVKYNK